MTEIHAENLAYWMLHGPDIDRRELEILAEIKAGNGYRYIPERVSRDNTIHVAHLIALEMVSWGPSINELKITPKGEEGLEVLSDG